MPELPEVQTVVSGLKPHIIGLTVQSVEVWQPKLRILVPESLDQSIVGHTITSIKRRAKYIVIDINGYLIVHLGMSGKLLYKKPIQREKHDHVMIHFTNGFSLVYNDPRRFGLVNHASQLDCFNHLGPEPLSREFNPDYLHTLCQKKQSSIKSIIMDQKNVVGVGNIYTCEALFKAHIDPKSTGQSLTLSECTQLVTAIKEVIENAITHGGTSIQNYRTHNDELGYFQQKLYVYGRAGEPCLVCGNEITRIVQNNRSTFLCSICQ